MGVSDGGDVVTKKIQCKVIDSTVLSLDDSELHLGWDFNSSIYCCSEQNQAGLTVIVRNLSIYFLKVIPKPQRNAVYGTENADDRAFGTGLN